MPTSHDFDGIQEVASSLVATTAGTIASTATSSWTYLPLSTVTSGNPVAVKVQGLVKGVTKSTAAAWLTGQCLNCTTAGVFAVATALGASPACAYAPAAAADTTGDVVLRFPVAASP